MKQIKKLAASLLFLALSKSICAQTDSSSENKVQFKLSLNYNTGLNYYGRTDSLKSSGFFPLAELWLSPHVYVNAAPVFVNNKRQSFDYAGTVTTIGYQYISTHWLTNLYAEKPFYKQSSQLVQSALKMQAGVNLAYLNKIININAGADLKYSDKTDFGATGGLDHIFRIQMKDNSVIILDPSCYVYAGTQNFTNTYLKKNPGFLLFPGSTQQMTESYQQFNILAYECSLPLIYSKNKWQLLVTPSYILPQNLVTVPGHPELSERGKNMFYATIGIKRSF